MSTKLQAHDVKDGENTLAASLEDYAIIARDELPPGLSALLKEAADELREKSMNNEVEAYPGELAELRSRVRDFSDAELKLGKAVLRTLEFLEEQEINEPVSRYTTARASVLDLLEDGEVKNWLAGLQSAGKLRFQRFPVRR